MLFQESNITVQQHTLLNHGTGTKAMKQGEVFVSRKCKQQSYARSHYQELTGPTMSETWETVVPDAAPRYSTFDPGGM